MEGNRMTRIIAVVNQKGGVAKSTTSINLPGVLAELGKKVAVVDVDPQANTTSGFGINPAELEVSLVEVLNKNVETSIESAILSTPFGVDLIPSALDLTVIELAMINYRNREYQLKNHLESIKDRYEYIFLDCPPNLLMLTTNAIVAATEVMVPLKSGRWAIDGMRTLFNNVADLKRECNPNLQIAGVFLTMTRGTNLDRVCRQSVEGFFGNRGVTIYKTEIPQNVTIGEAQNERKPINFFDPDCSGARAYKALAEELIAQEAAQKAV